MNNEVQMVPLTALESQAQRDHQTMRYMAIGWCISIVITVFCGMVMMSYEEQVVEEATETNVEQAADNSGANYFANGDLTNGGNAEGNGQEN